MLILMPHLRIGIWYCIGPDTKGKFSWGTLPSFCPVMENVPNRKRTFPKGCMVWFGFKIWKERDRFGVQVEWLVWFGCGVSDAFKFHVGLAWCDVLWYAFVRDKAQYQNGWLFWKVSNGLWFPAPSFSENHIAIFFQNSWPKYRC